MATEWEDLRKQAKQTENQIELKLISFSKLGTGSTYESTSDKSPLLSSDHMFDTMAMELEDLLARLNRINDSMADYTRRLGMNSGSAAMVHTMQRHRDILQDYNSEFRKVKSNISQHRQREDLLGDVKRDIDGYRSGIRGRTDLLLKENEHLRNADRLIDEQISIAMATKENLSAQRNTFSSITKRVVDMTNRFPTINNLIGKINLRRKRDSLILGGVISLCVIFLLWWVIS